MKQIFDWLREHINKHSYSKYYRGNWFASFIDTKIAIDIINEAEAKWEAEQICQYVKRNDYPFGFYTSCGGFVKKIKISHEYCPYCGKPIKISEVE